MHFMDPIADEDLVPGLVQQDEATIRLLVDRYWERSFRTALPLVAGDPASAEDVAQQTFVEVLRAAKRFEQGCRFQPWFFRILQNTASNHRRSQLRRKNRERRVGNNSNQTARTQSMADVAESRELHILVREHLARLKPQFREVLALRYLEEMSLKDVAAALNCPAGTVASRIRRGLEALRSSLQPALPGILPATELVGALKTIVPDEAPHPPTPTELRLASKAGPMEPDTPPTPPVSALIAKANGPLSVSAIKLASGLLSALAVTGLLAAALSSFLLNRPTNVATGPVPSTVFSASNVEADQTGAPGNSLNPLEAKTRTSAERLKRTGNELGSLNVRGRLTAKRLIDAWVMVMKEAQCAELFRSPQQDYGFLGRRNYGWNVPKGATRVGASGAFALRAKPGRFVFLAGARGCVTHKESLALRADGPVLANKDVVLRWVGVSRLKLKFEDHHGEPYDEMQMRLLTRVSPPVVLVEDPANREGKRYRLRRFALERGLDANGSVTFSLPPGNYRFSKKTSENDWDSTLSFEGPESQRIGSDYKIAYAAVELAARPKSLTLRTLGNPETGWIAIRVVNAKRQPLEGAGVFLEEYTRARVERRPQDSHHFRLGPIPHAGFGVRVANGRGEVRYRNVSLGSYEVFGRHRFRHGRSSVITVDKAGRGTVLELMLDRPISAGNASVRLRDGQNGKALEGSFNYSISAGSGGKERFPATLGDFDPSQTCRLRVWGRGYEGAAEFVPRAGQTSELVLDLFPAKPGPRPPGMRGQVINAIGGNITVYEKDFPRAFVRIGPTGAFLLPRFEGATTYTLKISSPGYADQWLKDWNPGHLGSYVSPSRDSGC